MPNTNMGGLFMDADGEFYTPEAKAAYETPYSPCGECGNEIPDRETSEVNRYHGPECSLNPDNTV